LENFDLELFENDPELHTFVHDNFVTHGSSGKRAIGDVGDIDAIEHPVAPLTPQGLATPLRRRLATPGQPIGKLSNAQELVYHLAPAIVHKVDKELAAIILKCFSNTYAKSELRKHCGSSGRAMLLHLEKRGNVMLATPSSSSSQRISTDAKKLELDPSRSPTGRSTRPK